MYITYSVLKCSNVLSYIIHVPFTKMHWFYLLLFQIEFFIVLFEDKNSWKIIFSILAAWIQALQSLWMHLHHVNPDNCSVVSLFNIT